MTEPESTQAAIWLARIERGLRPEEAQPLRDWLATTAHRDAIVEAAKLYHGADVVAVLAELVPVGFGGPARSSYKPSRMFATAVGSALLLIMAGVPFLAAYHAKHVVVPHWQTPGSVLRHDEVLYSTGSRQTRSVRLIDGTQLILNADSRLYVLYAAWTREATVDHGEAIFEISPDFPKPFLVFAGGRQFEAPASRFDVRVMGPQAVEVTVLEGAVTVRGLPLRPPATAEEVREFDPTAFSDATVGPLQTVLLADQATVRRTLTASDAQARVAWQPDPVLYVMPTDAR